MRWQLAAKDRIHAEHLAITLPGSGEGARAENAILVIDDRRDASILTNIDAADDATLLSFHDRYSSRGLVMHERLSPIFCSFPVPAARWLRPQYSG